MGSITFGGLATGLDTNALIDSLMEIERIPLDRLETDFADDGGDPSVEINVEELVKKVEAESDAERKKEVRRKLEELAEEKSFEDTYAIDFDD